MFFFWRLANCISIVLLNGAIQKLRHAFLTTLWPPPPMSHPVTHQTTRHQTLRHTHIPPNATDCMPNIESEVKIMPNIIRIIRYSGKYQVLLSQCDTLNVSKNIGSHYSVSPQSMVMTGGQTCWRVMTGMRAFTAFALICCSQPDIDSAIIV